MKEQKLKLLKRTIIFRIFLKYLLMGLLILFTVTMMYGAWKQMDSAYVGYFGMLLVMALMMIYPSKFPLYKNISQENYETILEYLTKCNEMSPFMYVEMLYVITPEINKLLYVNDYKEDYYLKNIGILQSLLRHDKEMVITHPITFSQVCKKLLEDYQNKNEQLDLYISELFKGKVSEIKKYKISIGINIMAKYVIPCILITYLIFKIVVTVGFYQCIETNELIKIMYNVGADMIALIAALIEKYLEKH